MIVGEVMGDTKSVKAKNQRLRTLGNRKEMKGSSQEKKEQKEYINLAKNRQNIEKRAPTCQERISKTIRLVTNIKNNIKKIRSVDLRTEQSLLFAVSRATWKRTIPLGW